LGFSSVCTPAMNIQVPELDWPSASASSIGIMGESGWNPNREEDPLSTLPFPSEGLTGKGSQILIVEDNASDVYLIRAAMKAGNIEAALHVVSDGEQAIRFVDEADSDQGRPCPALVILDINLPRRHGGEVLQHIRQSAKCSHALVIAVSTSDSARDREQMEQLGVDAYFRKPSSYDDFMKLGEMVRELLSSVPRPADPKEPPMNLR